jgi:hypothetical protein
MTTVSAVIGAAIVFLVLLETFESLVLPRRVTRRLRFTRLYYRVTWRIWFAATAFASPHRRETALSIFGPLSLLTLFAVWVAALIVGFGLLHHAAAPRPGGVGDSIYLSGGTFTTLGYGDVSPEGPASRVLSVAEGATGFGFFAVVIAYLPVLYAAFSRRESFIARLDARAGSPPAAGRLLQRFPPGRTDGAILAGFFADGEVWAGELLEAQLSYPVLGYYRSQHDNQSWLAALACVLDTTALSLTVLEGADRRQARLTFAMARHAVVDLALVLKQPPQQTVTNRLTAARLGELLAGLGTAGVAIREDAAEKLTELRGLYEPFLTALAAYFHYPLPDMWPTDERPDNWQTSAWMRRAGPLTALGDEHFA